VYQGLCCKVLHRARHQAIVAAVPWLPAGRSGAATAVLGLAETALGGWVLAGVRPRSAAAVQTGLLIGMNAGGLAFAGDRIAAPGRLLARNTALLALIWHAARPTPPPVVGKGRG
jgi:hypothetical protein